jgi:cytochrome c biogenesis factor
MAITFLISKIIIGGYWLIFAPALFLPLGTVLLSSQARRGIVGYLVLLLAVAFAALGVIVLLALPLLDAVTALAGVLAIWCLAAAITLVARKAKKRRSQSQQLRTAKLSITR